MTIRTLQRGSLAPEVHHLRPLMMKSSPSRVISVWMFRASLEATAGSVMEKALRISPASNGSSHCFFWSAVPNMCRTSMLPVSGAAQLIASGAISVLQPDNSASGAYSRLVSPDSAGRNRFHSPCALAFFLSSSTTGGTVKSPGPAAARYSS